MLETQTAIAEMQKAHEVLSELRYEPVKIDRGYTNRALRIDLSKNTMDILPVTQQMKDLWIGGKGFDLWFMLQEIHEGTKWDSPENPICIASGPLGGTASFPGSGKSIVTAISPLTSSVMDCNVGGYFGPYLKFAGFDILVIVGKAQDESIVCIDGVKSCITIEKAPLESIDSHLVAEELTSMYAVDEMDKRNIAVVSAGRAAQYSRMGVLNFSFWDWRRAVPRLKQAGRGGIGTVFRDKKMKAIVIKNKEQVRPWKIEENQMAKAFTSQICDCPKPFDKEAVKEIISKWNTDPEYVIEMLQDIQEKERYISKKAIEELSLRTGVPQAQLYHIATFYKAFSLNPRGEHVVEVCVGTACHVRGSQKILDTFERVLGVKRGETTKDGKFTLEAVACLGCCSIAPVVKIGDQVLGNVQNKDIPKILENCCKKCETQDNKGK
jgi:NADH:ubiquinone oxidoreductase subunit E